MATTRYQKFWSLFLVFCMVLTMLPLAQADRATIQAESPETVTIDETNFPDPEFRDYLRTLPGAEDSVFTAAELNAIETIICTWTYGDEYIHNLTGIEYFPNLTFLNCEDQEIHTLDVSRNTKLVELYCSGNLLTELDVTNNPDLSYLGCNYNDLTVLDVSKNPDLMYLDCNYNDLTALDMSKNPDLVYLDCGGPLLSELNVSKNPDLEYLACSRSRLTELDLSKNPALTDLYCYINQLTGLDLSKNPCLVAANCGYNRLTELDVSNNPALKMLNCDSNRLTELNLSKNTAMVYLSCCTNQLTKLDLSKNPDLAKLDCIENRLTELDLSKNANMTYLICAENRLTELDLSKNPYLAELNCIENCLTELDLSQNPDLETLRFQYNIREVAEGTPVSELSPRFDLSKVSNVQGGSFENGKVHFTGDALTYQYDADTKYSVAFTLIPPVEFSDVDADDWFSDAVRWAVRHRVTKGYPDGTFLPKNNCTRKEVVTFLWNAHEKPTVGTSRNPFVDVSEDAWYAEPVLWAAEWGITAGKGQPNTFAPNDQVMRREFVTFLWRAHGCPHPYITLEDTPFTDVEDGQWFTDPILWAYENGITQGKGREDTFAPKDTCTRAEIVTFLSRAFPFPR